MRLAMINTRMPGVNTFLLRDLHQLIREGVHLDLWLFETGSLDTAFRAELEASGGRVFAVPFPVSAAAAMAFAGELVSHPVRTLGSLVLGLRCLFVSPSEGARALAVLPASILIGQRMKRDGIDQTHGLWAGVPTSTALWIHRHTGLPYSFSGHAWDVLSRTSLLSEKVARSRGMIVCSEFARATVEKWVGPELARRVSVVHHGLQLSEWSFRPDRSGEAGRVPLILAVGRLTMKKGFRYLIEACAELRRRGVRYRCEIVGPEGGIGADLRRQIAKLDLSGEVSLVGELPSAQVRERMQSADLFVMPSIQPGPASSDGIPNVVLEAMSVGTHVIATDAGGLSEVLRHGETGRLVPQRDSGALATAIADSFQNPEGRRREIEAARALIESSFDAGKLSQPFLAAIGLGDGAPDASGTPEPNPRLAVARPAS